MTTFHLITQGCSQNYSDSEQMAGLLAEAQFKQVFSVDEADMIIFNTCTVKDATERNFFKQLEQIKEEYPYKIIIIAGCIAQTDPEKLKDYPLLGTKQIHRIREVVEEALNENKIRLLNRDEQPPLNLPKIRNNRLIEIIPINRGCLGKCAYCKTKAARGNLVSYPIENIITAAKKAIKEKVSEIWLTSQDTGCYGFDLNTNLPDLLKKLIALPGKFKIRIGMMNLNHYQKIKDELIPLLNNEKIFRFIHLPLQSGSDKVLKEMNRNYVSKEMVESVTELKRRVQKITLTTDIIVGFPGESEEDFWETLTTVRKISPDNINISKYSARPKTPAAELDQLPGEIIKKRSQTLTDIFQNISRLQNEKWVNHEGEITIIEKGKLEGQWIGRNQSYKQIIVIGNYCLGDTLRIKITKAGIFDLKGEVID